MSEELYEETIREQFKTINDLQDRIDKEIKEIIGLNCEEEIEVKYLNKYGWLAYETMDDSELLDYITNLQEENKELLKTYDDLEEQYKSLMKQVIEQNKRIDSVYDSKELEYAIQKLSEAVYWLSYVKEDLEGEEQ